MSPAPGDLVRIDQLKLAVLTLPGDDRLIRLIRQKLQQELPQLHLRAGHRRALHRRRALQRVVTVHHQAVVDGGRRLAGGRPVQNVRLTFSMADHRRCFDERKWHFILKSENY